MCTFFTKTSPRGRRWAQFALPKSHTTQINREIRIVAAVLPFIAQYILRSSKSEYLKSLSETKLCEFLSRTYASSSSSLRIEVIKGPSGLSVCDLAPHLSLAQLIKMPKSSFTSAKMKPK